MADGDTVVEINTNPAVPRNNEELWLYLTKALTNGARAASDYIQTGDMNAARVLVNELLVMATCKCKSQMPRMMTAIMRGEHPLSEGEREVLKQLTPP